jgi:hypothetical protein
MFLLLFIYGIDKLINTEVAIITIAAIGLFLLMRNSLLNKLPPVTLKENTRPLTVSNNKKISNDNLESSQHIKKNDTSKQPFKKI